MYILKCACGLQAATNFGLIQFSAIQGMKLVVPILWQQRAIKNSFQEKELSHKCFTCSLMLVRVFVAAAATGLVQPDSQAMRD